MDQSRVVRWKVEAILATLFTVGAVLTVAFPQWVEALGLEPDGGDGSFERVLVAALGVAALASAALSRRDLLRGSRPMSIAEEPET